MEHKGGAVQVELEQFVEACKTNSESCGLIFTPTYEQLVCYVLPEAKNALSKAGFSPAFANGPDRLLTGGMPIFCRSADCAFPVPPQVVGQAIVFWPAQIPEDILSHVRYRMRCKLAKTWRMIFVEESPREIAK